jgi:hypothetical protein
MVLKICQDFFDYLETNDIKVCHWKSNSRLDKGLEGGTDLDLLVDRSQRPLFSRALAEFGFKRILPPPGENLPDLEDHLGFDHQSGRLVHLHLHYSLITGQKYIKNHHLPLERFLLENSYHSGVLKVPLAEAEMLMLIIRASLKLRPTDLLRKILGETPAPYPEDVMEEFSYLCRDYDRNRLLRLLQKSDLPVSQSRLLIFADRMSRGSMTVSDALSMRNHLLYSLKPYRRMDRAEALRRSVLGHLRDLPLARRLRRKPRKTLKKGGLLLAVVGADGSGKSSLVRDLTEWLSWKLETRAVYYGIPKTVKMRMLNQLCGAFDLLGRRLSTDTSGSRLDRLTGSLSAARWIQVARKRRDLYRQSRKMTEMGLLVLSDRYPLPAFWRMTRPMDGPRIRAEGRAGNGRRAAREEEYYGEIGPPDHLFILRTGLDELKRRKEVVDERDLNERVAVIEKAKNEKGTTVIDGESEYPDVLLDLKRKIWELI